MNTFTIGFTGKTAEQFFELLKNSGASTLIDVRLNNTSQLAGFSKKEDLRFFLKQICNMNYIEMTDLAPEADLLKNYKNKVIGWNEYEMRYREMLAKRSVERRIEASILRDSCLLCSEHKPHHCHRRVALEYLNENWGGSLQIKHLF